MMDGWDGGMSAGGWVLMAIFWIVLIAIIAWALVMVVGRGGTGSRERVDLAEPPEEILDRRLASGEIDSQTYDTLRNKLREAHAARG